MSINDLWRWSPECFIYLPDHSRGVNVWSMLVFSTYPSGGGYRYCDGVFIFAEDTTTATQLDPIVVQKAQKKRVKFRRVFQ